MKATSFAGLTAAITGAGSGIGRALTLELARRGCRLALADIDRRSLEDTVAQAQGLGVEASADVVDVARRDAIYAWADKVGGRHGAVNLLFNNAGVALGSTVEGMADADFEWVMSINFWGVVHGTRAFLPLLRASGDGHVVNVSSVFGLAAIPTQSAYNASKFAVRGFTESLRQELELSGAPVSATTVHPGGIKTNIARAARWGADMQGFLGADEARGKARFEGLFLTAPEAAARAILDGVRRNRRRVLIGPDARLIDWMVRLLPAGYQPLVVRATRWSMR